MSINRASIYCQICPYSPTEDPANYSEALLPRTSVAVFSRWINKREFDRMFWQLANFHKLLFSSLIRSVNNRFASSCIRKYAPRLNHPKIWRVNQQIEQQAHWGTQTVITVRNIPYFGSTHIIDLSIVNNTSHRVFQELVKKIIQRPYLVNWPPWDIYKPTSPRGCLFYISQMSYELVHVIAKYYTSK